MKLGGGEEDGGVGERREMRLLRPPLSGDDIRMGGGDLDLDRSRLGLRLLDL